MYLSIYPQTPAALLALFSFGVSSFPKTRINWSAVALILTNQQLSASITATSSILTLDTPLMSTKKGVQNV